MSAARTKRSLRGTEDLLCLDYWRQLCPKLHIEDHEFQAHQNRHEGDIASSGDCAEVRMRLIDEGFAVLPPTSLRWSTNSDVLAEAMLTLWKHGWPPTFITVYDEAWVLALDASRIMTCVTGNELNMDILGFVVDPKSSKGFSPHRDRQQEDWMPRGVPGSVEGTFKADGMAKYVTLWAALTDAHPDNSCLHFVPKHVDPGYTAGDPNDGDPLQRCIPNRDSFQSIRAAPVARGGCSFHTHRTIHWGNSGRASYTGDPRVALSFGFSSPDFEPSYFRRRHLPFPCFMLRVRLAAAQILNYATLAASDSLGWSSVAGGLSFDKQMLTTLYKVFQNKTKEFDLTYRKEIAKKYCAAFNSAFDPGDEGRETARDDNDLEDELLQAMLDAEADTGEVLFRDDCDMLEGPGGSGLFIDKKFKRKRRRTAA